MAATILCFLTIVALRGNVLAGSRLTLVGFDGISVIIGFVAFVLGAVVFGPLFGMSLVISVLLHELGHVLAYQFLGYENVRFRFVPLFSGVPISDTPIRTEGHGFFIALMGPGICVAPMALAYALSIVLQDVHPEAATIFRTFAVTCGTINFINLLPFWPLDGGKCARIFAANFWPALAPALAVFMAAMFATAAIRTQPLTLLIMAMVGAQSIFHKAKPHPIPMGADNALIAMAAYSFTMAAHFSGGYWLLSQYM